MKKTLVSRFDTNIFTKISNDLTYSQETLSEFLQKSFSLSEIENQIALKSKNFSSQSREILVNELKLQYTGQNDCQSTLNNIELLRSEKTFTITTGHQLSLLTGPLYFIYKILHVVKLAETLRQKYPKFNFVPMFWMASEDHDFEEIRSIKLFGEKLVWNNKEQGAVGRFGLEGIAEIKDQFIRFFKRDPASEVVNLLSSLNGKTYADAMFHFVNTLFKDYGLVVLNPDSTHLKQQMIPIFKNELISQFSFKAVTETNNKLEARDIKTQVHAREINLFYLSENARERILYSEGRFKAGKYSWSESEMLKELESNPENFSPNVVLRPLYQEFILPNLLYVGGGGELAYWLQLKGVFKNANTIFPLLQIRNSLLLIDELSAKRISQLKYELNDLFLDPETQKKNYVRKQSAGKLDLTNISKLIDDLKEQIADKTINSDKGLEKWYKAKQRELDKFKENLSEKLMRTEKKRFESEINKLDQLHESFFAGGSFQERYHNFFNLCGDGNVYSHLKMIYDLIDPLENDLIVAEI